MCFFGLSFSVPLGKSEENRADGASYREKFELYKYVSDSEFYKRFNEYFTFEEGAKDYYFDTVAFYVSRVTDNYHITSLGGRFMVLAYPVIAYIWLVNFKAVKYDKVLHTMPLVFLFSFYTQFLLYKNVLSPTFYFSSPFYLLYKYF